MYVYIYIYTYVHSHLHSYLHIYIWYPPGNLHFHTSMIDIERKVLLGFGRD